jgi:hypothetical protein
MAADPGISEKGVDYSHGNPEVQPVSGLSSGKLRMGGIEDLLSRMGRVFASEREKANKILF